MEILRRILNDTTDQVVLLTREGRGKSVIQRGDELVAGLVLPSQYQTMRARVRLLHGDIAEPRFGLNELIWRGLSSVSHILHVAASTQFDAPLKHNKATSEEKSNYRIVFDTLTLPNFAHRGSVMPTKGRLKDTLDYLYAEVKTRNGWLTKTDIDIFAELVSYHDMTAGGNTLSLGWSWYNSRPSKDLRKAIRAYVMISIYNGDIKGTGAAGLATRLKTRNDADIHRELKDKIKKFITAPPIWTKAVCYSVNVKGHGKTRATANAEIQNQNVPLTMAKLKAKNPNIAVMLIDMQSNSDDYSLDTVTAYKQYDGKPMLQHMIEVLEAANQLDLIVYDIVIDQDAAAGRAQKVKTIPPLRREMPVGSKHKFMPKPSYNSFESTPLAKMLKADNISTLVVMGFHGNICVKNTIFGTPEYEKTIDQRTMNANEKKAWLKKNPAPADGPWKDIEIPKVAVKGMQAYNPGLLDRDIKVVTSRSILATAGSPLESDYKINS